MEEKSIACGLPNLISRFVWEHSSLCESLLLGLGVTLTVTRSWWATFHQIAARQTRLSTHTCAGRQVLECQDLTRSKGLGPYYPRIHVLTELCHQMKVPEKCQWSCQDGHRALWIGNWTQEICVILTQGHSFFPVVTHTKVSMPTP